MFAVVIEATEIRVECPFREAAVPSLRVKASLRFRIIKDIRETISRRERGRKRGRESKKTRKVE